MKPLAIQTCPTCGSREVRRVKRDIMTRRGGDTIVAKGIEVEECGTCGERLFSPEAIAATRSPQAAGKGRRRSA